MEIRWLSSRTGLLVGTILRSKNTIKIRPLARHKASVQARMLRAVTHSAGKARLSNGDYKPIAANVMISTASKRSATPAIATQSE